MLRSTVFALVLPALVLSQAPDTLWTRTIDGPHTDLARCIVETPEGDYVFTGARTNNDSLDVWLMRIDQGSQTVWTQTLGFEGEESGYSVQQTSDGGFVIAGYTTSEGAGGYDSWLVKTTELGAYQWSETFGGSDMDIGHSVVQTPDGGYAMAGITYSFGAGAADVHLVRTDSTGTLLWEDFYGGSSDDYAHSLRNTSDGGFIITGYTASQGPGPYSLWLIKTDGSGNVEWDQTLGGTEGEVGQDVRQTSDGGYIITGYTTTWGSGLGDLWLVRTDGSGNMLWDSYFGGSEWDTGMSVIECRDGGFAVAGYIDTDTTSDALGYDLWVLKTDSTGEFDWEILLDNGYDSYGMSLSQIMDDGYIIAGYSWTDVGGADDYDAWLIRLASETGISGEGAEPAAGPVITGVFPNPSSGAFDIRCLPAEPGVLEASVYTLGGSLTAFLPEPEVSPSHCRFTWNGCDGQGNSLPSGVYLVRVSSGVHSTTSRMVLIR
jgi:hypothetical protein